MSDVWDGAWLPDTLIVDMRYGHIFKLDSDPQRLGADISRENWMKVPHSQLKRKLRGRRLCLEYARDSAVLRELYKSHPTEGGHLPNRVIAISHTIGDMLKMSDYPLIFYARKKKRRAFERDLIQQNKGSVVDIYENVRCGLVHQYLPYHTEGIYGGETRDPGIVEVNGRFQIIPESYIRDLQAAVRKLLKEIERDADLLQKYQEALALIPRLA